MSDPGNSSALLERLEREIGSSRKYRGLDLPPETLRDLLEQEQAKGKTGNAALQGARGKLHNIIAPYLGDPDYSKTALTLEQAFQSGQQGSIQQVCRDILMTHASTRERIPQLEDFYQQLWAVTGIPGSILDLACALHPFGLPWMGLPAATRYFAFDLHTPRIKFINRFFELMSREPLAVVQDILISPPRQTAEVALFFKEAHRFEQRRKGSNRPFFEALQVKWLLVSLPAVDLSGHHSLVDRQRRLMESILSGLTWPVSELLIGNELVFCIQKA